MRLYPFNRILAFTLSKKKDETYSLFSTKTESKTQVVLYDFNAKKVGDYDLAEDIENI